MQNVDFSRRIKHSPESSELQAQPMKMSERAGVRTLAIAIITFTLGIVAGVQITRVRGTEALVRYPDQPREAARSESPDSLANIANDEPPVRVTPPESHSRGRYLIKVGSFSPDAADRLARRLGRIGAVSETQPVLCQGLKEDNNRSLLFRIEADQGKENLFLGCFETPARAHEVLEALKASDVTQAGAAVVFEIE